MGTTADKLNRLKNTKEGIRYEINRAYGTEILSTSSTFKSYIEKLEDHPYYLKGLLSGHIESILDSSVTSVGDSAFTNALALNNVSLPNATSIGESAFTRCSNLISVSFSNATIINSTAFYKCSNLTSVSFPKVTDIRGSAFEGCTSLTSLSFPKLTTIANGSSSWLGTSGVFKDCSALVTIYIGTQNSTVCTLGSYAFYNCSNLTNIYVPARLVDSYKNATNWSSYATKIKGV